MRLLVRFVLGLVVAAVFLAVAGAAGYPEYAALADGIAGGLGLVVAFALATGLNLGMWLAIKDVDGDRVSGDGSAAVSVAVVSAALLLCGFLTALAT
jgi:hypothetical protein